MRSWVTSLVLTASAVTRVSGAVLELRDCQGDNCLRAVRATNSPERQLACSSYFRVTVTHATVTFTAAATLSFSAETTLSLTQTNTEHQTATNTLQVSETDVVSVTQTGTQNGPGSGNTLKARQQTVVPSSLPAWAGNCKDGAAFSSACSCLGYTMTTIVVPAPSTTITNTVSETKTNTILTTETVTQTLVDTTVTNTNTIATVTRTDSSAIATATACILQVTVGDPVVGQYIVFTPYLGEPLAKFTPDRSLATPVYVRTGGLLFADAAMKTVVAFPPGGTSFVFDDLDGNADYSGTVQLKCNIAAAGDFTCVAGPLTSFGTWLNGQAMLMGAPGTDFSYYQGVPVGLKCLAP